MLKLSTARPFIGYAVVALAVLSVNLWQVLSSDSGRNLLAVAPFSDAYLYHYSAWFKAIISSDSFVSKTLALSPYEVLLGASFKLFGHSNLTPFVVNSVLSMISCVVLMVCARKLFSTQVALLSGLIYLLCDPILFFAGTTLKTNLVICITAMALLCAICFFNKPRKRWVILFSILIFVCAVDRIHVLVLPVVFIIVLWSKSAAIDFYGKAQFTAICGTCFFVMYGLSSLYYESEPGYLSPVGLNIYLGHTRPDNWNLRVDGIRNHVIGHREDAKKVAETALNRKLNNSEVTSYWLSQTAAYIKANPFPYLKTQAQKFAFLLSPSSYLSQESYYHWRKKNSPLSLAFVNFALIMPLFVVGIFLFRTSTTSTTVTSAHRFTALAGLFYLGSLMATIVIERYRVTAFIFMIPMASAALLELFKLHRYRLTIFACLFSMLGASFVIDHYLKPTLTNERISRMESNDKAQRTQQQNWFNLRSSLDQEPLSRESCISMQNALQSIGYHRDLKALAVVCAQL